MDKESKKWQERFEKVWDGPDYRQGSPGLRLVKRFIIYLDPGCTVNDYGSGTGRAAVALLEAGFKVNMIDFAPNALEDEAKSLLGKDLTFTLGSLWEIPKDFPTASWGFCMEVLQTLPYDKLLPVLRNIKATCDNLFIQVASWPDTWNGVKVNQIIEDSDWWETEIKKVWEDVEQIPSLETSRRFLFVCRGKK